MLVKPLISTYVSSAPSTGIEYSLREHNWHRMCASLAPARLDEMQ
jgi:hypothetical protein